MRGQFREFTQQVGSLLYMQWDGLCRFLQATGVLPSPPTPAFADLVESTMEREFRPVEPSANFRASLRDNLQIAVQHQADGMVIEYPYVLRYRVVLGVSAGVVAAAVAALVLIFRPRTRDPRR
jgi:hypothetical protein